MILFLPQIQTVLAATLKKEKFKKKKIFAKISKNNKKNLGKKKQKKKNQNKNKKFF